MALEHILAAIAAEGDQACAQIAAETERQVAALLAQADARAAELCARELRQGEEMAQSERATRLYQARLEAGRRQSLAWEESYQAALAAAQGALSTVRERLEYPLILRHLLLEAFHEMDTPPVISIDPRDETLVLQILRELGNNARLETSLDTCGGVEMRTQDGRIMVRNTLESRFAKAESFLRSLVSSVWAESETGNLSGTPEPMGGLHVQ